MPLGPFPADTSQSVKDFLCQNVAPKFALPQYAAPHTLRAFKTCISLVSWPLQRTWSPDKDRLTDEPRARPSVPSAHTGSSNLMDVTIYDMPLCSGRFSDIYKGEWKGYPACLKVVRLPKLAFIQISSSEVDRLQQLSHPNVLPFYGVYQNSNQISLVSQWMENGDLTEYLKHHQTSNRVQFVYDVARGLNYLHENEIVHGDLKGKNVLVGEDGRAVLADFGLSSILDPDTLAEVSSPSSVSQEGTVRWCAPETFNFEGDKELPNTKASDVYAFAMVCYEIFTNELPFSQLKIDVSIMRAVVEGERPLRPPTSSTSWSIWGLTDNRWSILEACWLAQSEERPTMQDVVGRLTPPLDEEKRDYQINYSC